METPGWGQLRGGWRCQVGAGRSAVWGALCHCLPLPWCQQQHPFSSPHARRDVLEQPCALGGVPPESGTCVHPRRRQHPRRPAALASCVPGARRATRPATSPAGTSARLQDASATALPHSPAPAPQTMAHRPLPLAPQPHGADRTTTLSPTAHTSPVPQPHGTAKPTTRGPIEHPGSQPSTPQHGPAAPALLQAQLTHGPRQHPSPRKA